MSPGWYRCLFCHIDVCPDEGHVAEDPPALVLIGFVLGNDNARFR